MKYKIIKIKLFVGNLSCILQKRIVLYFLTQFPKLHTKKSRKQEHTLHTFIYIKAFHFMSVFLIEYSNTYLIMRILQTTRSKTILGNEKNLSLTNGVDVQHFS